MKFRDITSKPTKKIIKPATIKRRKNVKPKETKVYEFVESSLSVEIDKNFKGSVDGIAGLILELPKELQSLISNANLKQVIAGAGHSMFTLDNGFVFKLRNTTVNNKPTLHIIIKQKNKTILDRYV